MLDLLQRFKDSRFVSAIPEFEESWLNEFLNAVRKKSDILNLDEKEVLSNDFMKELKEFLGVSILLFLNFSAPLAYCKTDNNYFLLLNKQDLNIWLCSVVIKYLD